MDRFPRYIKPLDSSTDLEVVGGKGKSLAAMLRAGLPIPAGFHVTISAYQRFVEHNDIARAILELATPVVVGARASFETPSTRVMKLFERGEIPSDIADEVANAYAALDRDKVAVRSSANAEDLPNLSFAGQQETYLNVYGHDDLLIAVKNCWASLWTTQALSYRHEMDVDQSAVAMAVIIQAMVPADVSGILFTANPATGQRDQAIVNCSYGLGEAVVGGQVTPDTFVLDKASLELKETVLGSKEQMIVSRSTQGTHVQQVPREQRDTSSLSENSLKDLVSLAKEVEQCFVGQPQDIEWAIYEGEIWLLQSRPITHLPEPPPKEVTWPMIPGAQLLKRQVAENMPDPLSPLFEDLYLRAIFDTQTWPDGWEWNGRLTKNWMKNFVVTTVNGYAYQPIYHDSGKDWERFMVEHRKKQAALPWHKNLKRAFSLQSFFIDDMKGGPLHRLYLVARTFRVFRKYPALVTWEKQQLPDYLARIKHWRERDHATITSQELLVGMKSLTRTEANYWHALRSVIGTAKQTDGGFHAFLEKNAPNEGLISGSFLSGFASKTLEAEKELRHIVERIRTNEALYELTIITPTARLLKTLKHHPEGRRVRDAVDKYLDRYGRQVFNLDFVEPTLAEAPSPFVERLKALVVDPGFNLATRQKDVARDRRSKWRHAMKFFRGTHRIEFLRHYWTARVNYPAREEALFYMGLAWSTLRPLALELGSRLCDIGDLNQPDDVFYLTSGELSAAIKAEADSSTSPELKDLSNKRRKLRRQRFRMNQPSAIPPLKNDKSAYATIRQNEDEKDGLRGFAVSPGRVTGIASVIMSPDDFDQMQPGSILVCPLTTPAWTQLFPHATGLVTDIGSILAHGSIVAREYGIPAVLGVGDATQRLAHGQRITVNGDKGVVTIE